MARILVINDDDTILDLYEAVIRDLGHEAVTKATASSGPEIVHDVETGVACTARSLRISGRQRRPGLGDFRRA